VSDSQAPVVESTGRDPETDQQPNILQGQLQGPEAKVIDHLAKRLMDECKDEIRQKLEGEVNAWPEEKKQQLISLGINPTFFRFRQHVEELYKRGALDGIQQQSQQATTSDAMKFADRNVPYPPCNTLYVGNLPMDTSEDGLKAVFSKQRGYKRLCFRTKQNGPMCFVEFEDTSFATEAIDELNGYMLPNSVKGGIRLTFSKNPLGVRNGQEASAGSSSFTPPLKSHENYDFNAIVDQQAEAMRAWDQGEEVVPASVSRNPIFS
jgi:hypothetical protein